MRRTTDVKVVAARLYFLPVRTRVPLKFGREALTSVTCARAAVTVADRTGRSATGWGETPLSVQWVWPSDAPYTPRHAALKQFSQGLGEALVGFDCAGHPIELAHAFIEGELPALLDRFNRSRDDEAGAMPHLASLVAFSAFDIALHDAFGVLHGVDVYDTYNADWMNRDLGDFLGADEGHPTFKGRYPAQGLIEPAPSSLVAWHLVGGLDALTADDLTGDEPQDGHPVMLEDWIARDGLRCLKIKLRGTDQPWDYDRIVRVGRIAERCGIDWLTTDFNCTVTDAAYVCEILDKLRRDEPRLYGMVLYVEQPFPYDLEAHALDVHAVSARKPLYLDESAHDWRSVRLGRRLGWTGVALKTCKTQTGALLSLCWAKAHGMELMVQDLTNPMLAMIPHARLAAHAGTIMGLETNACQYYPDASDAEAAVHEGLYRRRGGCIDLSTIGGPGFGYRLSAIDRALPEPAAEYTT